jgi:hypothetical protein
MKLCDSMVFDCPAVKRRLGCDRLGDFHWLRSRSPRQRRLPRVRLPARARLRQGSTRQHISPRNARTTPAIAPTARMERYLVDQDLPVRRILAMAMVTATIPTHTPIEIEIPHWKLRRATRDGGRAALRSLLPSRPYAPSQRATPCEAGPVKDHAFL